MQVATLRNQAVRTTFHISPEVAAAAILQAQSHGLRIQEWLDRVIVDACMATGEEANPVGHLTNEMTIELFARMATYAPGALVGRWKLLFDRVLLEHDLWDYPRSTPSDLEEDPDAVPHLCMERLRKRWPALLAASFAM
ncbi:putative uncharacterized protein [Burkholderiales bacterium GJ-E10]|nr:putative uncharacterized protein [Burkholderiales bacterium GJ-E10]